MAPTDYSVGIATIVACVVVAGIVTFKQRLIAHITYLLVEFLLWVGVAHAGLVPKSVELRINDKVIRAHFLERVARTGSRSTEDSMARQDILVVPGFTAEATVMASLIPAMNLPPHVRVCIMELPLHGKNVVNFDGKTFPTAGDLLDYTLAFVEATGLGKNNETKIPLSMIGYSLGGGMCLEMLARQPPDTYRKVLLLAPALKETICDDFLKLVDENPRKVHGWETLEECEGFYTKTAGGFYPNKLPPWVLVATHRKRELAYAPYDKSFFTNYFRGLNILTDGPTFDETKQKLLARHKTSVLVVCGDRDNCISSNKCRNVVKDFDDRYFSFHELLDTGHVGGPANKKVLTSTIDMVGPIAAEFFMG